MLFFHSLSLLGLMLQLGGSNESFLAPYFRHRTTGPSFSAVLAQKEIPSFQAKPFRQTDGRLTKTVDVEEEQEGKADGIVDTAAVEEELRGENGNVGRPDATGMAGEENGRINNDEEGPQVRHLPVGSTTQSPETIVPLEQMSTK